MNYWKQFAEMLGLKLGQEFVLTDDDGNRKDGYTYQITKNGILYKSQISEDWFSESLKTIGNLLNGKSKAVPKAWKPKYKKAFWYYSVAWKKAFSDIWLDGLQDLLLWKIGNCFETEEEASTKGKEIMEKLRKEYEEA